MTRGLPMRVVFVGHVDHGKSTLVGRILHDTGSLPDGKAEQIRASCERRGMAFEFAFLLDALQAERDQGITIDTTQTFFHTARRDYVIIDAPGHKEFLRNMVTGAAQADAAILVVDADEGIQEQSRRHGYLLHLLGIRQVLVAVNKMDLVDYRLDRYADVAADIRAYLADLGIVPTHIVPVSGREGDNVVTHCRDYGRMDWYEGLTLVDGLDAFTPPAWLSDLPLRMPVQDVYKFDQRRIVVGRIESGRLRIGDEVMFSPSNSTARIRSIESWGREEPLLALSAGQTAGVTLDQPVFVERGEVMSHLQRPPTLTNVFRGRIFWLGKSSLELGKRYVAKLNTADFPVEVEAIEKVIDVGDLAASRTGVVERNAVAEVVLRSRSTVALDPFSSGPRTGRFVLVEGYDIVGGGTVDMRGYPDQRNAVAVKSKNIFSVEHDVSLEARWNVNGHRSGILWFTGLSGAGKSTLAIELERRLFAKGFQVYVLDGDNIRHGLSADLGFSPEDRNENIRRIGEVAALFARAGVLVVTAFISPYRADRDRVRQIAPDLFHEIHIKADVDTCERRDPKGLYKKARSGEIREFTGVSAPYEAPDSPDLEVDTSVLSVEESLDRLLDYVDRHLDLARLSGRRQSGS
ncbi:MAG: adenylyl-sulfate kinase [Acetobacterales bacterium]